MTDPTQHQIAPKDSRWTHFWRWLWRGIILLWSLFILGIIDSIIATRLTSDKDFPVVSPVGRAMQNLPFTLSLGLILLLITTLTWVLSRQRPSQHALLPSEQDRFAVLRMLRQEYTRQLNHSLQGAAMMELNLHERTDVILSSTQFVFRRIGGAEEHSLPPGTSIVEAYDAAGHGLLILGEPGAGKTTLLLYLARELLTRAEGDSAYPIPVIVNLSSWAIKQPPLASWLIEQLQLVYRVPTRISTSWLEYDQWLFLLDGLDEVEASARARCIEAINTYHGEHLTPLVVCSRTHEYLAQEARLALPSAVVIQPLQEVQVRDYLKRVGKPMAAVRAALKTNPTFQQIITTPLMLNVVILAYQDKAVKDLPHLGSAEEQQHQIFERYIERMLAQPVMKGPFTPLQIRHWLSWLAHRTKQYHLSEFYLERLQPTWLPTERSRTTYSLLVRLLGWLLAALSVVLGLILVASVPFISLAGLLALMLFGLLAGMFSRKSKTQEIHPADVLTWSWKEFWPQVLVGLLVGLVFGLLVVLYNELLGFPLRGLPFTFGSRLVTSILVGLLAGLLFGLLAALLFGLAQGFTTSQITEHLRLKPNQGILSSGWNALYVGLTTMLLVGLLAGLFFGLLAGLFVGLLAGLFVGLLAGLFVGLYVGGGAYFQHYLLRYLLCRSGAMPWRYVRFLEEASERILLQKVGGGYRFIHPLFLDYFASQLTAISSSSVQQSPSQRSSSTSLFS